MFLQQSLTNTHIDILLFQLKINHQQITFFWLYPSLPPPYHHQSEITTNEEILSLMSDILLLIPDFVLFLPDNLQQLTVILIAIHHNECPHSLSQAMQQLLLEILSLCVQVDAFLSIEVHLHFKLRAEQHDMVIKVFKCIQYYAHFLICFMVARHLVLPHRFTYVMDEGMQLECRRFDHGTLANCRSYVIFV